MYADPFFYLYLRYFTFIIYFQLILFLYLSIMYFTFIVYFQLCCVFFNTVLLFSFFQLCYEFFLFLLHEPHLDFLVSSTALYRYCSRILRPPQYLVDTEAQNTSCVIVFTSTKYIYLRFFSCYVLCSFPVSFL